MNFERPYRNWTNICIEHHILSAVREIKEIRSNRMHKFCTCHIPINYATPQSLIWLSLLRMQGDLHLPHFLEIVLRKMKNQLWNSKQLSWLNIFINLPNQTNAVPKLFGNETNEKLFRITQFFHHWHFLSDKIRKLPWETHYYTEDVFFLLPKLFILCIVNNTIWLKAPLLSHRPKGPGPVNIIFMNLSWLELSQSCWHIQPCITH